MSSISVLMSVYKSENAAYLSCALKSIWSDQEVKPDEVIIIKDGPLGDDLNTEIDRWKNVIGSRLIILCNKTNLGLTKSLNIGIKAASGEYIARMDSDDISTPNRFMMQREYLDAHPDIDVVGGFIIEFNHLHDNLGIRKFPIDNKSVLRYIYKASPLAHPAVMMRKSLFDQGLSYNEKYRTSQDIALWFDVLKSGHKIGNLEEIVLKFRRDGDVYKRRSREKAYNEFIIYFRGIRDIYGPITWKYIYPIARFCFRLMPLFIVRELYNSNIRSKFLQ